MTRLAPLLPFVLVACVDSGDEGMYIVKNIAVSGSCTISADPGQPFLGRGFIYSQAPSGYLFTPLIQSRLTPLEGDSDEISRTIQMRRADITLRLVAVSSNGSTTQQNLELDSHSSLFAGVLPPGGYMSAAFDLITSSHLRQIHEMFGASDFEAEVVATATVKGVINDDEITSSEYVYPVTVCSDCVVNVIGACPITMGTPRTGHPCNPYQDGAIDCCTETDGGLTCPARL